MDHLDAEFEPLGFRSIFVYVREAHPAEHLRHHTSFAQKLAQARLFRDEQAVRRQILVDALDGTCHRRYGALPNMTWIVMRGGTIAYKAAWTDADDVRDAMRGIARLADMRRKGGRLAPFWTERLGFRIVDQAAFNAGLQRNGPQAVADFAAFVRQTPLDRLED